MTELAAAINVAKSMSELTLKRLEMTYVSPFSFTGSETVDPPEEEPEDRYPGYLSVHPAPDPLCNLCVET